MTDLRQRRDRAATQVAFLVAGFGMASWAPLVPFAKQRLGASSSLLGLVLLAMGVGSIMAMLAAGPLTARYGCKPVMSAGGMGLAGTLPLLTVAYSPWTLAGALLLFGAALGSIDVAMNVHAIDVERRAAVPLISSFHALFSLGSLAGAASMTALLTADIPVMLAALAHAALMCSAMLWAGPALLPGAAAEPGPVFAVPRGVVLLLAGLTAICFLIEGAMLDWAALLLVAEDVVAPSRAGIGYSLFTVSMALGRTVGDRFTGRVGNRRALLAGGTVGLAGFALLLLANTVPLVLAGFITIGLGVANGVPILFRLAGRQERMLPALAISALTTAGYTGLLLGPVGFGWIGEWFGLKACFVVLAGLWCAVPAMARWITR